jgi:membrane protease YdiL (CAAX protease family)
MWVREAPPMGRIWILPALAFAILPAISLGAAILYREWIIAGWMVAAVVGAAGAGYALVHLRTSAIRPFVLCQLTAGVMGVGISMAARAAAEVDLPPLPWKGLHDFALYFPVCFALEEVSFRGVLDAHLHRPGQRFGLVSALLGSVLWGLWHWPTIPAEARGLDVAIGLVIVHALIGVPLAIAWRRSGNLTVTAFTHAMLDGVRNALRVL